MSDSAGPRRILIPTDFSEASGRALDRASALAAGTGAVLVVFHAEPSPAADATFPLQRREEVSKRVRAVGERMGTVAIEVELVAGTGAAPDRAVLQAIEQRDPDLVVMGTHGGGLLSGSVAERVAAHASCDVLVVRRDAQGDWPEQPGTILVPVDFSDPSRRALSRALALAGDEDEVVVVHVVDVPRRPSFYADAVPTPLQADPGLRKTIEDRLVEWAAPAEKIVVVEGEVRRRLADQVEQCDAAVVVVGTRGLHAFPESLTGGTVQFLIQHAVAPVLTVR